MELSWVNKLRIFLVAALGMIVIGILAGPLAVPEDPFAPIRAANIGFVGTAILLILAFAVGFGGYFLAWPHGREIAVMAVPFGLTVWATRSGPMRILTQALNEPQEREALLRAMCFEPFYWLLIVATGFTGVVVAQRLRPSAQPIGTLSQLKASLKPAAYANVAIALVVCTLVAQFFVGVFSQDLTTSDNVMAERLLTNYVAAQPAVGQIIFGVIAAFAVAGFVTKKFLDLTYVWPAIATVFIIPFAKVAYYNAGTIEKFTEIYPATFYPHPVFAILPVQLVSLGALGAILGYWLAVRYEYWRKHESA